MTTFQPSTKAVASTLCVIMLVHSANLVVQSPCFQISVKTKNVCLGPRQHMNSQTSFLDGSQIYGSTPDEAVRLRRFQDGLLVTNVYILHD